MGNCSGFHIMQFSGDCSWLWSHSKLGISRFFYCARKAGRDGAKPRYRGERPSILYDPTPEGLDPTPDFLNPSSKTQIPKSSMF